MDAALQTNTCSTSCRCLAAQMAARTLQPQVLLYDDSLYIVSSPLPQVLHNHKSLQCNVFAQLFRRSICSTICRCLAAQMVTWTLLPQVILREEFRIIMDLCTGRSHSADKHLQHHLQIPGSPDAWTQLPQVTLLGL